ncbi:Dual serine/threonine and tyrosine protein kinase [Plecturocebus cupreus]
MLLWFCPMERIGEVGKVVVGIGQLSCISFPPNEEKSLQQIVDCLPCILILGQDCNVKRQLLNLLLGVQVLPTTKLGSEESCKLRRLRFTYGTQTRVSLALPGQYELVHTLVAHQGNWETIPEEDLEVQADNEDAAHVLAELEVWWRTPVVPATQEAEAGGSLEPRGSRLH